MKGIYFSRVECWNVSFCKHLFYCVLDATDTNPDGSESILQHNHNSMGTTAAFLCGAYMLG